MKNGSSERFSYLNVNFIGHFNFKFNYARKTFQKFFFLYLYIYLYIARINKYIKMHT